MTHQGIWTAAQILRVQGPVYAAKAKRERDAKRRAMFGPVAYQGKRRNLRYDAKALIFRIKYLDN